MQKHLSVPPVEMAASIERMQEEGRALQRTIRAFQEKLAVHEANALLAKGSNIVVEAIDGWDAQGLKAIAVAATADRPDAIVVLFTTAMPAQVVVARGANATADANAILKQLATKFGGKGGGKPDLAQGGGMNAQPEDLVNAARKIVTRASGVLQADVEN
jgi:alanyl-tRNA synthetase